MQIDETNFNQYFFDVKTHSPQKNQVMARYTAMADFVDGELKRNVILLLKEHENGAFSAAKLMQKKAGAIEKDSYRVCKAIADDLFLGASDEDVAKKPYRFQLEYFYYTDKENIPKNDPHWSTIPLISWKITDNGNIDFDTDLPDCVLPSN